MVRATKPFRSSLRSLPSSSMQEEIPPREWTPPGVVELVQLSTNKRRHARLVGVNLSELDQDTVNLVFSYFAEKAQTDSTLHRSDYENLRYKVCYESATPIPPSNRVAQWLANCSNTVMELMENNETIRESDDIMIKHICPAEWAKGEEVGEEGREQTDACSPKEQHHNCPINFSELRDHLLAVFTTYFSGERQDRSSIRLLIDFAVITHYCYSFCKKVIEYTRASFSVFDILCEVASALMIHLANIQWKAIVEKLGGWDKLASSVALGQVTWNALWIRRIDLRLFFGAAALCTLIGTFLYFTNRQ